MDLLCHCSGELNETVFLAGISQLMKKYTRERRIRIIRSVLKKTPLPAMSRLRLMTGLAQSKRQPPARGGRIVKWSQFPEAKVSRIVRQLSRNVCKLVLVSYLCYSTGHKAGVTTRVLDDWYLTIHTRLYQRCNL